MPEPTHDFDVAIVGGNFAGLSAALPVARARRRVAVFDHGLPRNRFASASHGFLGQDGRAPDAIRHAGRAEVAAYPTARIIDEAVLAIEGAEDGFHLRTAAGTYAARRIVLAFGMRDVLPEIPGLADCWGRTAQQCPYCHGYELADRPTGILMSGPAALHHAQLLREWSSDLILFADGHPLDAAERAELTAAGLVIFDAPVVRLEATEGRLAAVHLADGARVPRATLYLTSRQVPACDLAERLGCAMTEGPKGPYVAVDVQQRTSTPGVYAAGDLVRPFYNAPAAAADGALAGAFAHQSLLMLRAA